MWAPGGAPDNKSDFRTDKSWKPHFFCLTGVSPATILTKISWRSIIMETSFCEQSQWNIFTSKNEWPNYHHVLHFMDMTQSCLFDLRVSRGSPAVKWYSESSDFTTDKKEPQEGRQNLQGSHFLWTFGIQWWTASGTPLPSRDESRPDEIRRYSKYFSKNL